MSQQGGRPTGPTGPEDDWWGQLYDDSTDDTGPTAAPDSLDDRFASASGTVAGEADPGTGRATNPPGSDPTAPEPGRPWWSRPQSSTVPGPRTAPPGYDTPPGPTDPPKAGDHAPPGPRAPWEPPPATPTGPVSFPPGPGPGPGASGGASPLGGRSGAGTAGETSGAEETASPQRSGGRRGGVPPGARPAGPPGPRAPWEPPSGVPAGPVSFPPGPRPGSAGAASPGGRGDGAVPPAAVGSGGGDGAPGASPGPGGRRPGRGPRGLTTSGTGAADLTEPPDPGPPPRTVSDLPPLPPPFLPTADAPDGGHRDYVGSGPPTYDAEPTALPPADPDGLDGLVPDTVLEGARYGTCTLRAVSVRGDSARYRGEPRRDALLVARFGAGEQALVLVAMATGARATAGAHRAAAEVCRWIGRAVGRSHARLAEDLRAARRGDLKSGLHRLTDRSLGRLRAGAAAQGLAPDEYAATLRCLLLPADPECRTRVFFGVGAGGLLRLRDGAWQDMEPDVGDVAGEPVLGFGSAPRGVFGGPPGDAPSETLDGDRLTMDLGITTPPGPYDGPPAEPSREPFRFRASVARPGDVLLMCTAGLAEPLLSEPGLGELLARRWAGRPAPGPGEFLADSGVRVKGYADDRTAAAVWEA
ncbi:protein phosphatase 2C domain-containing protein [Streptomyces tendae]